MSLSVPVAMDLSAALGLFAVAVLGSILAAWLEDKLRFVAWAAFDIVATPFAFAARGLLQFWGFLSHLIDQGMQGLSDEGRDLVDEGNFWIGWYIIGPVVYFGLFLIFISSDFSIAYLVFEAFGMVAGAAKNVPSALPLETAVALLFVALGAFWGLLYFDLLQATPFSYIWSSLDKRLRQGLIVIALMMFALTLFAALLMGVWRQWQLAITDPPEPWNSMIPPAVSGILTLLVVAATAFSGKPVGSGSAALWVAALLIVRSVDLVMLVSLRLVVMIIRRVMQVPFALVAVPAYLGHGIWNWLRSYPGLQAKMHLAPIGPLSVYDEPGGDLDAPILSEHRRRGLPQTLLPATPLPTASRPSASFERAAPIEMTEERRSASANGHSVPTPAPGSSPEAAPAGPRRPRASRGSDTWGTRGGIPI